MESDISLDGYDFFILVNIAYFPESVIRKIIDSKQYLNFRGDIPVMLYTQPPSLRYRNFYNLWQDLFDNAKMNIFISPMQFDVFSKTFGFDIKNCQIMPPPLPVTMFNDKKQKRNGSLYVGDISHARGCMQTLNIMKNSFPNERYTFVGKILDEQLAGVLKDLGATVKDPVSREELNNIMNEHKRLFYFPEIYDSFCLKVLEAEQAGIDVIADTLRIGYYSYEDKSDLVNYCNEKSLQKIYDFITMDDSQDSMRAPDLDPNRL